MDTGLRTPAGVEFMNRTLRPGSLVERDFFIPRIGVTVPSLNIQETPGEFILDLAVPGFERKDFDIELDDNILSVNAAKEDMKEDEEGTYSRVEYSVSSFSRSFMLPDNVNEESIDAKYENGVLTITVPKISEASGQTSRKILVG